VYFGDDTVSCEKSVAEVNEAIGNIVSLSKRIEQLDIKFAKHPKFLKADSKHAQDFDDEADSVGGIGGMEMDGAAVAFVNGAYSNAN